MKLEEADDKAFQVFEIPMVVVVADALAVFSCPFHDESNVRNAYEAQLRLNHETKLSEFAYQWTWMEKISQDPEVRLLSSLTWKAYLPLSDDPCRVGTCDSEAERNFAWLN